MKYFLVYFFIQTCVLTSNSQNIIFKCYVRTSCSNKVEVLDNYTLSKGNNFYSSLNNGEYITLPDTGIYKLTSTKVKDSIYLSILRRGLNIDTVKGIDIYEVLFTDSKIDGISNGDWVCCGKLCNGYKIEYYNNGFKWFDGTYKKGKPIGVFRYYNINGKLIYQLYYSRKGKFIKKVAYQ